MNGRRGTRMVSVILVAMTVTMVIPSVAVGGDFDSCNVCDARSSNSVQQVQANATQGATDGANAAAAAGVSFTDEQRERAVAGATLGAVDATDALSDPPSSKSFRERVRGAARGAARGTLFGAAGSDNATPEELYWAAYGSAYGAVIGTSVSPADENYTAAAAAGSAEGTAIAQGRFHIDSERAVLAAYGSALGAVFGTNERIGRINFTPDGSVFRQQESLEAGSAGNAGNASPTVSTDPVAVAAFGSAYGTVEAVAQRTGENRPPTAGQVVSTAAGSAWGATQGASRSDASTPQVVFEASYTASLDTLTRTESTNPDRIALTAYRAAIRAIPGT